MLTRTRGVDSGIFSFGFAQIKTIDIASSIVITIIIVGQ